MHEAWLEEVVPKAMPAGTNVTALQNALQFPTSTHPNGRARGLKLAIDVVNQHPSAVLKRDVFPILVKHKKNAWSHMENMLSAYRYFKECRNAFIHGSGIGGQRVEETYLALRRLKPSDLGLHGQLKLPPLTEKKSIKLALPDVVALSSIINSMIVTLDAALAVSEGSEKDMLYRIHENFRRGRSLPKNNQERRRRTIAAMVRKAGLPEPANMSGIEALLQTRGIV